MARSAHRRATGILGMLAAATLTAGLFAVPATAQAATATVGDGITTSDLTAVGVTATALAQELAGTGVNVSNVSFTGAPAQAGRIHSVDPAVLSFNDGIILSTGSIADVVGPNKSDGITGDMAGAPDADLNTLIAATQTVNPVTFDAAALEFDFVPQTDKVYFTYTFGSDEYLEWVNLFNDVFAFYVNGQNCATVPNGDPISIDTINDTVNPQLFRDNSYSAPPVKPINVESDGLSVEMICSATVNPGQTNHMKLAIADTSDQILDSVVMLKASSLSTTPPEACNDGHDNDDDTLVDMDDDSCTSTTTAAPVGQAGVGSDSSAPPFTGNEGTPITLDASALGWQATPDTVSTSWTVNGINGTAGTCTVDPAGRLPLNPDGSIAVVTALCPADGEYVARVDGWDVENKSAFDMDVDFFVHNAPPTVSIDSPVPGATVAPGDVVTLAATVVDPGSDSINCDINWGDGTTEAGSVAGDQCTGSHVYADAGQKLLSVTVTDDLSSSAAAATLVDVTDSVIATPPAAPAAPNGTRAIGAVELQWTAPTDGGAAVDGYEVQVATKVTGPYAPATGCTAAVDVPACTATGLISGKSYYFRVRAHNLVGWGEWSPASAALAPAAKPTAAQNPGAIASGPGRVTVNWTPPASDGGAAVDKYAARAYPVGSTTATKSCAAVAPDTTCGFSAMQAGSYTVKVQAHNGVGWGPLSAASAEVTTTGVPGPATAATISASGPGRIVAGWEAPATDGGEPIDKYTVRVFASGTTSVVKSCTATAPAATCSVSSLPEGTFVVTAQAHNAAGWGPQSAASGSATITGVPGAATAVVGTAATASKVTASWSAPDSNGGEAIDKYIARVYPQGSTTAAKSCTVTSPASTCTMSALAPGSYLVKVQAHNVAGWGPVAAASQPVVVP